MIEGEGQKQREVNAMHRWIDSQMIEGEIKERERRERDDRWIDMWMDGHVDRERQIN